MSLQKRSIGTAERIGISAAQDEGGGAQRSPKMLTAQQQMLVRRIIGLPTPTSRQHTDHHEHPYEVPDGENPRQSVLRLGELKPAVLVSHHGISEEVWSQAALEITEHEAIADSAATEDPRRREDPLE